ncbi:heterochromatin protein 1 [Aphelenchoides avenae]|nr:heterochromatin protein 1 [Aphelenchus avenae]
MVRLHAKMEGVYTVEKILDKRHVRGKLEYQIKWLGWENPEDITWEPAANCDCPELKKEFEENWKKDQKARRSSAASKRCSSVSSVGSGTKVAVKEKASADENNNKTVVGDKAKVSKPSSTPKAPLRLKSPVPGKVYRCQQDVKIKKVLGVRREKKTGSITALVAYEDGKPELVPTQVVAECDAEIIIKYYEGRLQKADEKEPPAHVDDAQPMVSFKIAEQKNDDDIIELDSDSDEEKENNH